MKLPKSKSLLACAKLAFAAGFYVPLALAALVIQPAMAKNAEQVGTLAGLITVRIEGATEGSGVLVSRGNGSYRVLTAWHVLKRQGRSEELTIITADGIEHRTNGFTISRVGNVDLATISFASDKEYRIAEIGLPGNLRAGVNVFVYGYPLATNAVNKRIPRFLKGELIANASSYIKDGYQLIYSNPTLPGMSGGPVLSEDGLLVGIHGRGETDYQMTQQAGIAVKTGNNLAVPISYYRDQASATRSDARETFSRTYDDYIALAEVARKEERFNDLAQIAGKAISKKKTLIAYHYLVFAQKSLGESAKAKISAYKALKLEPRTASDYFQRGLIRSAVDANYSTIYEDYGRAYQLERSNQGYRKVYMIHAPSLTGARESLSMINDQLNSSGPNLALISWACELFSSKLDSYIEYSSKGWAELQPRNYADLKQSYEGLVLDKVCIDR